MENSCLFEQAKTEESKGNRDKALEQYTQFINLTCRNDRSNYSKYMKEKLALAYNNRGFLRYLRVDFDEAIEDYTRSVSLDPDLAVTYYNRGTIHYRLSRFDNAIADMEAALRLNPDFTEARTGLERSAADKQEKLNRGW
ncbi:tetratricopeptide repeat protein 32-like [Mizuhopecten yessoensis]|uniref:tetratricopeptide repeat protein 32-like n=1 Tax=Mizuhopecten yessoensis TaxID=6573 RepID=UPI000B45B02B|nr:tetratricopeptide repeat protein 32-like [Mizuhopecten yessoensis]